MVRLGKVAIGYADSKLNDFLLRLRAKRTVRTAMPRSLARYILPDVTLNNLKHNNIVFYYDPDARSGRCELTKNDNAEGNQILFSHKRSVIGTSANTCFSLILNCKPKQLASAIHVSCVHNDPSVHNDMFLYAFANIRKIAHNAPIWAYISGCNVINPGDLGSKEDLEGQIFDNRTLLTFILPELVKRRIDIKVIDIGRNYEGQVLSLRDDIYYALICNF